MTVICFDLDGTLFNNQGIVHPKDIRILTNPGESQFIIATGRSLQSTHGMFSKNRLFVNQAIPFPLVLQNGSLIYGSHEILLDHFPFPPTIQKILIRRIRTLPHLSTFLFDSLNTYLLFPNAYSLEAIKKFSMKVIPFQDLKKPNAFSKMMCVSMDQNLLNQVVIMIEDLPVEYSYSMENLLEITPSGVDKGSGLRLLIERLDLINERLFVAGDSENDLPLFQQSDCAFTTITSKDVIKLAADHVIDPTQDGLLEPIMRVAGLNIN